MNYVVIDLEWNQCPYGKDKENPKLPFEILEIGAVKLNENREIIDTFSETVRPAVYKTLHYRTKEVIGERLEEFKASRPFPEVARDFLTWCGKDYMFCVWGPSDLPELQRNLLFYHIPLPFPKPLLYYDVQKLFSLEKEDGKLRRSLEFAVEYLKIEKNSPFHKAFDDTYYTSLVLQQLNWDDLKTYLSVDYFRPPTTKEEELYLKFKDYSKFVSRVYENRDRMMADRNVTQVRCFVCGRLIRRQLDWFPTSQKQFACMALCPQHGLQKGKIRVKKAPNGNVFAIRTIKIASPEQAEVIKAKNEAYKKRVKKQEAAAAFQANA